MRYSALSYRGEVASDWDAFLNESVAPSLLFRRGFMDYHADRFSDASVVVRDSDGIVALVPASRDSSVVTSHGGLTYGGLVWRRGLHAAEVLDVLRSVLALWEAAGVERVIWKAVPRHYMASLSDADLYALFRMGAELQGRSLSAVWLPGARSRLPAAKRRNARGARRKGVELAESRDASAVYQLIRGGLTTKYGVEPTHSLAELALLKARFPEDVRIIEARADGTVVAGAVVFRSPRVDHVQYLASSNDGRRLRAQDALMEALYDNAFERNAFLDLGVSTEQGGRVLNESLMSFKEEFGGRPVAYDTYSISLRPAVRAPKPLPRQ